MTQALDAARIAELLAKYDRPGPRYTSYPTAVEFSESVGADDYERRLADAAGRDAPLSLYFHLPFCSHRCTFCGCNVVITSRHEIAVDYLETLFREIDLVADRLGSRTGVRQLHWGGGTPTFQTPEEMESLFRKITERFRIEPDAEPVTFDGVQGAWVSPAAEVVTATVPERAQRLPAASLAYTANV